MQIPEVFSPTSGSAVHLCFGIALYMLGPTKGSQTYRYCGGQMVGFTKDHNKVWLLGVLVRIPGFLLFIWNIPLPTMKSLGKLQKVHENSKENSMCACVFVCMCLGSPRLNSPSCICFLRVWVHYFCLCVLLSFHCLWIHLYLWFFIRMSNNTITSIPRLCRTLEI